MFRLIEVNPRVLGFQILGTQSIKNCVNWSTYGRSIKYRSSALGLKMHIWVIVGRSIEKGLDRSIHD